MALGTGKGLAKVLHGSNVRATAVLVFSLGCVLISTPRLHHFLEGTRLSLEVCVRVGFARHRLLKRVDHLLLHGLELPNVVLAVFLLNRVLLCNILVRSTRAGKVHFAVHSLVCNRLVFFLVDGLRIKLFHLLLSEFLVVKLVVVRLEEFV